jgi:hypothetical protein
MTSYSVPIEISAEAQIRLSCLQRASIRAAKIKKCKEAFGPGQL